MSSIDERIVQMQFENSQFEKGVNRTIKTLGNLKKNLEFDDATGSLEDFQKMGDSFSLANISDQLETLVDRTSWFGRTINGILDSVTARILNFGKSLSVGQISTGWNKYTEKTASVQTIINSTGKSLEEVNNYLSKLMWFSDETSYNFSEMTSALATLTSSGGDIDKLIPMIEGMATATSFAGKGAAEFSRVIYNLNQSYGQGYLSYIDWKSVEGATVSSKQLKQAFLDAAVEAGTLKKTTDGIYKTTKGTVVSVDNFSSTLNEKWATKGVMEGALGTFAAVMEEAYELVQNGTYETAAEAIEAIGDKYGETSYKAAKSAQSAKSFAEAVSSVADAVSTGWMRSFEIIFGDMEEATELWTKVTNGLLTVFTQGMEYRNTILQDWKNLGGRTKLIESLERAFKALWTIIEKVKESFKAVFPPITVDTLMDITNAIERMSWWLYYLAGGADAAAESINNLNNSSVEDTTDVPFNGELKRGSKGDDVKQLQTKLEEAGFSVGEHGIDGILGPDTEAALKQYEESIGLAADGIYDQLTHYKLYGITIPIEFTGELKRGDKGDKVKLLQQWLEARGFSVGEHGIDGIFGPDTEAALKAFEESIGVTADGVYDEVTHDQLTWNKAIEDSQKTAEESKKKSAAMALAMKILYAKYKGLIDNLMGFVKLFFAVSHLIAQTATFVGKVIWRVFDAIWPLVQSIIMVMGSLAGTIADAINGWLSDGPFTKVLNVISNWLEPLKEWATEAGKNVLEFFGLNSDGSKIKYAEGEMSRFAEFWENVKTTVKPVIDWLKQAIKDVLGFFGLDIDASATYEAGDALVDLASGNIFGVISGITNNINNLGNSSDKADDEVSGFVKTIRNIKEYLKPVTDWISQAWNDIKNFFTVTDEVDEDGNAITSFQKKWTEFKTAVKPVTDWLKQAANDIYNFFFVKDEPIFDDCANEIDAITSFQKAWDKFKKKVKPVIDWLKQAWKDVKNFFTIDDEVDESGNAITSFQRKWLDFKNAINPVTDWLKQAWKDVKNFFSVRDEVDESGNAITSFQKKWVDLKKKVKPVTDWLKQAWKDVKNFFTLPTEADENGDKITKFADTWQKVKDYLKPITDWFATAWDNIKNFFTIKDEVDENGNAITSCALLWKKAKNTLEPVFTWLKKAWEWIKSAFSGNNIKESLINFWTKLCEGLSKLWTAIVGMFKSAGESRTGETKTTVFERIGNFFSGLFDFFDKWGLGILGGGVLWTLILKIVSMCGVISELFKQFSIIKNGADKIVGNNEKKEKKKFDWIVRLGIGIALIAASIFAIGSMDPAKLKQGAIVVGAIALFVVAMGVLSRIFLKKAKDVQALYTIGKTFIRIGAALLLVAAAIWILGMMDMGALIKGGIAVGLIALVMVIIVKKLSGSTSSASINIRTKISGFLGIAAVIISLALAILILGNMRFASLVKGILAVTVIIGGLVVVMKSLRNGSNADGSASTIARITGFALAIMAMVAAIWLIGNMKIKVLLQGFIGLAAVMAMLMVVIKMCGKVADKGSYSVILKIGSIAILLMAMVGSISILGNMKTDVLIKGLLSLAVVVGLLFVIMKAMSSSNRTISIKETVSIVIILTALAGFLLVFAQAMRNMEGIDSSAILAVGVSIAAMFVAIAYACKSMKTSNAGWKDILKSSAKLGLALAVVIGIVTIIMGFIGGLNTLTGGGMAQVIENAVPVFESIGKAFAALFEGGFGYVVLGIVALAAAYSKLESNNVTEQSMNHIIKNSAIITAAFGVVTAIMPLVFAAIGLVYGELTGIIEPINNAIPVIQACGECMSELFGTPFGYVVSGVTAVGSALGLLTKDNKETVKALGAGLLDATILVAAIDVILALTLLTFTAVGAINGEEGTWANTINNAVPIIENCGKCISAMFTTPMAYVIGGISGVAGALQIINKADNSTVIRGLLNGLLDATILTAAITWILGMVLGTYTAIGAINGNEGKWANTINNASPVLQECGECMSKLFETPMAYVIGGISGVAGALQIINKADNSTVIRGLLNGLLDATILTAAITFILSMVMGVFTAIGAINGEEGKWVDIINNASPVLQECGECISKLCDGPLGAVVAGVSGVAALITTLVTGSGGAAIVVTLIGSGIALIIEALIGAIIMIAAGIFTAIGAINGKDSSWANTIEQAAPVFEAIGKAVGSFVGGMKEADIAAVASAVNSFGDTTIDESRADQIVAAVEKLKTLYDKFDSLTLGWAIEQGVLDFINADSPFIKFCQEIAYFGSAVANYSASVSSVSLLTGLKTKMLVGVAEDIKELYDTFENKNFFEAAWDKFSNMFGNGSGFQVFCNETMSQFATAITQFGTSISGIGLGILAKTIVARSVAESIAKFVHDISDENGTMYIKPDDNSILGWIAGGDESESDTFFGQMTAFATAAKNCATEMNGLTDITTEVGIATSIATSIAGFLNGLGDKDSDTYIKADKYGLTTWGWGEKSNAGTFFTQLGEFATQIVGLQSKIKEFSTNGFKEDAAAVVEVAEDIATFFSSLVQVNDETTGEGLESGDYSIITQNVEDYLEALDLLADHASEMSGALSDFKPAKMTAFASGLASITTSLRTLDQSNSVNNLGSIASLIGTLSGGVDTTSFDPTKVTSLVTAITDEFGKEDYVTQFKDIGFNYGLGIRDGLKSSEWYVKAEASYLCQQLIEKIKNLLGIASPSKVAAELGGYFGIGLANGVNSTETVVSKSGASLAETMTTSTRNALKSLNDLVSDTVSGDPIIRPIVDMSDVESSSRKLNGLLSADRSIDLASGAVSSFSRMKAAQKAEAAAASTTSGDGSQNSSYNDSVSLTGNNFYIRSEQDIHTLANEIASLTRQQQRSLGARY